MKRLITSETVETAYAAGVRAIAAPFKEAIVTPAAATKASELGLAITYVAAAGPPPDKGASERVVDPSGVIVVRGSTIRLGTFSDGGTRVGLTDVITGADKAPMTAGVMAWGKDESFPWNLTYDEVDYVIEGTLEIHVGGRVVSGGPGDIFYIPKGSRIVFGTPDRVRIFYVTYPAEWKAA